MHDVIIHMNAYAIKIKQQTEMWRIFPPEHQKYENELFVCEYGYVDLWMISAHI